MNEKKQAYKMGCLNLTLTQFIKMFHFTERRGLCLMKCTCETIQVFVMFFLSFNIIFALDLFWHIFEKKKVACNENVSLHFIKH